MSVDLLLDTNALLWLAEAHERATPIRTALEDESNTVTVTSIAYAEIAVKHSIGKLAHTVAAVRRVALESGIPELAWNGNHAEALADLPTHHKDPFDRMLIAQALAEGYTIATNDRQFRRYDVELLRI